MVFNFPFKHTAATVLAAALLIMLPGCAQPGTPIAEHQVRALPQDFPGDFPLHVGFYVSDTSRKLQWPEGDYFLVKFVTELDRLEIDYFFRKELGTDRGYKITGESATSSGGGRLVFEKGKRHVEVTFGMEHGKNTILLRLKDRRKGK